MFGFDLGFAFAYSANVKSGAGDVAVACVTADGTEGLTHIQSSLWHPYPAGRAFLHARFLPPCVDQPGWSGAQGEVACALFEPTRSALHFMLNLYTANCPLGSDPPISAQVLVDALAAGRTSRLISNLVLRDRQLLMASADAAYPGEKHSGLAVVYARPANGGVGQLLICTSVCFLLEQVGEQQPVVFHVCALLKQGVVPRLLHPCCAGSWTGCWTRACGHQSCSG